MRNLRTVGLTLLLAVLTPAFIYGQHQALEVRIDSIFAPMDTPTTPGCALSVMRDGAPIYERGYGMANLEYGIPITPHSVFHVASVSKHFTAMAVELLVNEGKVNWDDDIRTYVPEVPDFGTLITLRHLVHHVSGIRDQWSLLSMAGWRWEADVVTQKDVLDITSRQTALNFEPGSRYLYSNTGFTLLAVVVERISGQTLREFTTERFFEPLGMNATHFHDDHQMIVKNRTWAYEPDPDGLYGLKNSIPDFDVVGATSLFTTAHDMAAWDRNFYTGRVGGQAALDRLHERFVMTSGDTTSYAHGLSIGTYRGLKTVGHGGADAGYRSQFLRFPEQHFTVTVLCNFPSAGPGALAQRVADVYLADELEPVTPESDPEAPTVAQDNLQALAGAYLSEPDHEIWLVRFEQDTLRLDVGPVFPLRPLGNDRFELIGSNSRITLTGTTLDRPGQITFGDNTYTRTDLWTPAENELKDLAGTYHSTELGTDYRFEYEDGKLVFYHRKLDPEELKPAFKDAFTMDGRSIIFSRNPDDNIVGFNMSTGRVWNVWFDRAAE